MMPKEHHGEAACCGNGRHEKSWTAPIFNCDVFSDLSTNEWVLGGTSQPREKSLSIFGAQLPVAPQARLYRFTVLGRDTIRGFNNFGGFRNVCVQQSTGVMGNLVCKAQ